MDTSTSDPHLAAKSKTIPESKFKDLIDMMNIRHAENTGSVTHLDKRIDLVCDNNKVWITPRDKAQFDSSTTGNVLSLILRGTVWIGS